MSDTPRTDREAYKTGPNDVGFDVVNPALCRQFERAYGRALDNNAWLAQALDEVLALWPSQVVLDSLEPDNSQFSRVAPVKDNPRTADVRRWREALEKYRSLPVE